MGSHGVHMEFTCSSGYLKRLESFICSKMMILSVYPAALLCLNGVLGAAFAGNPEGALSPIKAYLDGSIIGEANRLYSSPETTRETFYAFLKGQNAQALTHIPDELFSMPEAKDCGADVCAALKTEIRGIGGNESTFFETAYKLAMCKCPPLQGSTGTLATMAHIYAAHYAENAVMRKKCHQTLSDIRAEFLQKVNQPEPQIGFCLTSSGRKAKEDRIRAHKDDLRIVYDRFLMYAYLMDDVLKQDREQIKWETIASYLAESK